MKYSFSVAYDYDGNQYETFTESDSTLNQYTNGKFYSAQLSSADGAVENHFFKIKDLSKIEDTDKLYVRTYFISDHTIDVDRSMIYMDRINELNDRIDELEEVLKLLVKDNLTE